MLVSMAEGTQMRPCSSRQCPQTQNAMGPRRSRGLLQHHKISRLSNRCIYLQILSPGYLQLPVRGPRVIDIGPSQRKRGSRFVQDADNLLRSQRRSEGKWLNKKTTASTFVLCSAQQKTSRTRHLKAFSPRPQWLTL